MGYKKVKPTNTKSDMINRFVDSVRIHDKWKSYRDTLHRLFIAKDKVKGQEEYEVMIGGIQIAIKTHQRNYGSKPIEAITRMGKNIDGMPLLKLLSAGYELMEGNDYCSKAIKHQGK